MSVSEDKNKEWLHIVHEWVERNKEEPLEMLFTLDNKETITDSLKQEEEGLIGYLQQLNAWLKSNVSLLMC